MKPDIQAVAPVQQSEDARSALYHRCDRLTFLKLRLLHKALWHNLHLQCGHARWKAKTVHQGGEPKAGLKVFHVPKTLGQEGAVSRQRHWGWVPSRCPKDSNAYFIVETFRLAKQVSFNAVPVFDEAVLTRIDSLLKTYAEQHAVVQEALLQTAPDLRDRLLKVESDVTENAKIGLSVLNAGYAIVDAMAEVKDQKPETRQQMRQLRRSQNNTRRQLLEPQWLAITAKVLADKYTIATSDAAR